jgi:AcrR family transcriptional regulator
MAPESATGTNTPPLRADARRNRARVVEAAQQAFGAEGLSVPLDEIARRAGVGAGTVYRHFPTKEALFEEIVLDRMREMLARVRAATTAADPSAAFDRVMTEIVEQNSLKKDLTDALAGAGVDIAGPLAEVRLAMRDALGLLLTRAQDVGAVRPDVDVEDLTSLLGAILMSARRRPGRRGRAEDPALTPVQRVAAVRNARSTRSSPSAHGRTRTTGTPAAAARSVSRAPTTALTRARSRCSPPSGSRARRSATGPSSPGSVSTTARTAAPKPTASSGTR